MTKHVWEEEWFVYDNEPGRWVNVHAKGIGHIGMLNGDTDTRAQLAAAAPELVRALLSIEHGKHGACPSCGYDVALDGGHNPSCLLHLALVRAGVRKGAE